MSRKNPSKTPEERIKKLRVKVDAADRALMKALGARMVVVAEIGKIKVAAGMPLLQKTRWSAVMEERLKAAARLGLSGPFTNALYALIHREALKIQGSLPRVRGKPRGSSKSHSKPPKLQSKSHSTSRSMNRSMSQAKRKK